MLKLSNLALISVLFSCAAAAQEVQPSEPPQQSPTASACELHVWPGRSFHSVYYGWAHGGTIDGAQKGRNGYPDLPDEPLGTAVQLQQLASLDLPAALGLSGYQVTLHDTPLSAAAIRTTTGRQLPDSAPCYAELLIDDIVFQNNVINGKWLNVVYRFRQFDGANSAPIRTFGTYILARVSLFPPAENTDPQPALDELVKGYTQTTIDFGKALQASANRKPKKK